MTDKQLQSEPNLESIVNQFFDEVLLEFHWYLQSNQRARTLLQIYTLTIETVISRSKTNPDEELLLTLDPSDLLRSVVVLVHASLETYLRDIGARWLKIKYRHGAIRV